MNAHRQPRCIAADLGASSGRVMAGALSDGKLGLTELHRFATPRAIDPSGTYQCWDVDAIEAHLRQGIAAAGEPVASVGIDSWSVDHVLLDEHLARIGPAISYRDRRTSGMIEAVCARMPAAEIYRRTGVQFQPFNTLYQLAATALQEPRWLERARHLLMIPDYLHFRLSGALTTEYTNATTTQCYGLHGGWDGELLAAVGVDAAILHDPVAPGTAIGTLAMPGGAAGVMKVIAPATHDTASAVAAAPLTSADEAYISSGTWSLMGIESRVPMTSDAARQMNFTNEGGVQGRFRILKNIMGMWLIQQIGQELGIAVDEGLIEAAGHAPAWRSLVDPGDPRFLNPRSMCHAVRTYCVETGQPEPTTAVALARCVFDSLALSYASVKAELETLRGRPLACIRIIGGGSRNRLLNQLCADACGVAVTAGPVETSAIGNICVQLLSLGALQDLDAVRALIRRSFPIAEYQPATAVPATVVSRFRHLPTSSLRENAL